MVPGSWGFHRSGHRLMRHPAPPPGPPYGPPDWPPKNDHSGRTFAYGRESLISALPGDWHRVAELPRLVQVSGDGSAAAIGGAEMAAATAPPASASARCLRLIGMVVLFSMGDGIAPEWRFRSPMSSPLTPISGSGYRQWLCLPVSWMWSRRTTRRCRGRDRHRAVLLDAVSSLWVNPVAKAPTWLNDRRGERTLGEVLMQVL